MSELKAYPAFSVYNRAHNIEESLVYLKSEADKVIAELKRQIEFLKVTTDSCKNCAQCADGMGKVFDKEFNPLKDKLRREKYKRCVAMSQEWRSYAAFCGMQSSCHNHRGFGKTAEHWSWKECHAWKCVKRWRKLAEKFKEA